MEENKNNQSTDNLLDNPYIYSVFKNIPQGEFICPKCYKIPTILNVFYDEGIIEFNCEVHGKLKLNIEQFYKETENSLFQIFNKKCDCKKIGENNNTIFFYCSECSKYYCQNCIEKHKKYKHSTINIKEQKEQYRKNFNNNEKINEKEKVAAKNQIIIEKEKVEAKNQIIEKNKNLSKIYRLNQIILNTYQEFPDNYFHIKSAINLGESINNESKELESLYEELKNKENEFDALKNFLNKHKVDGKVIDNKVIENIINKLKKENILFLSNLNLGNKEFQNISQILFRKIKIFDLSNNKIKIIEDFDNMIMPYLEVLDMSYNEIENIEPIAKLNCKNLKVISLQNNKIADVEPCFNFDFPKLKILRIENNVVQKDNANFKQLLKKYKSQLIYEEVKIENFNKTYRSNINNLKGSTLDLHGLRKDDNMLKDLYLLLTNDYESKTNNIKILKLDDNKLRDVSILSLFPLPKLKKLDLSVNKIKNLDFLNEMNLDNLIIIYLDSNEIFDIRQLGQLIRSEKVKNLKIIAMKNKKYERLINKLDDDKEGIIAKKNKNNKENLDLFKSKDIQIDLNYIYKK